ncbi:hypothetical protein EDC94DRAFT_600306 [Helicostylum pulchrum]|nr:hypothetical protein EDC94DRAFT_600306 [Helicostylum pulchrum]
MGYIFSNVRTCRLEKMVLNFDHWDTYKYWMPRCVLYDVKLFARHLSLAKKLEIYIVPSPLKLYTEPSRLCSNEIKVAINYLKIYRFFDLLRAFQGNRGYSHFEFTATIIVKREIDKFKGISLIRSRIFNRAIELEQTVDWKSFCKRSDNILAAKYRSGASIRNHLKKVTILVWLENFVDILEFVLRKCLFTNHVIFQVSNPYDIEKPTYLEIKFPRTLRPHEDPHRFPIIRMDYTLCHPIILNVLSTRLPRMTKLNFTNVTKQNIGQHALQLRGIQYLKHLIFEFKSIGQVPDHSLYFELHLVAEDDNKQTIFHKYTIEYFDETCEVQHFDELYSDRNLSIVASYTYIDAVSILLDGKLAKTICFPPIIPRKTITEKFMDRILHNV